jgi:hypothetical protein
MRKLGGEEGTENVAKRKYEGKFVFKHPPAIKYASVTYTATLSNWTRQQSCASSSITY